MNRLLVLDDDVRVLQVFDAVAALHRFETTLTTSIDEFQNAYAADRPSLIVLDLQNPAGDGIEVLDWLRQRACTVPILLVSGFDRRVLETARRIGESHGLTIVDALMKPCRVEAIGEILERLREPDDDEWADDLRRAIEHDQLAVHYQPKIDLASGTVVGFEALARWSHPTRGPIGPDRFIPLAEKTGLIVPLTDLVLRRALVACSGWIAEGFDLTVAVNVAAPSLESLHLYEEVDRLLLELDFPAAQLTLEITETTAMQNPARTTSLLGRLRLRGVGLALDDFGVGYSNLALLHRMPFTELKIDRGFVTDVADNRDSQIIVQALATLARSFGLAAVAEGVEDVTVCPWLRSVGIDQAQGYAIARPMAGDRVLAWLAARVGQTSAAADSAMATPAACR